ncbi:MAG: cation:dicarboxylate symporter family transporter [Candidatus Aminicenantaceae bacterium]
MGKKRLDLSTSIFIGLGLGIACGIFFGEYCRFLSVVGGIFIGLLQMSILPYIMVALIVGIGSLTIDKAKLLGAKGGIWLLLLWVIGIVVILAMPLAFPAMKTASFFSDSLVEAPEQLNILGMFIPSNPFRSMTDSVIPATVIFSIALGLALMGLKEKSTLLEPLRTLSEALTKITRFMIGLAPIGVFAITASAAGTVTLQELGRLQAYFISFIFAALILTFWILPSVIATFTPFKFGDILKMSKEALITGFATDSLFIVLPVLIENSKELFRKYNLEKSNTSFVTDIVIPISFNFPLLGRLLSLIFVLFAGWYYGTPIGLSGYPVLTGVGLFSMFGKPYIAMPFLLNTMHLPVDIYELYHIAALFTGRFATLVSAVHLLTLTILITCAVSGTLTFKVKKMLASLGISLVILAVGIVGINAFLSGSLQDSYTKDKVIAEMQLLENPVPSVVHQAPPAELPPSEKDKPRLPLIRERGALKVGFLADRLPFSYFNSSGDLVGFDVELMHILARELDVSLEFIPTDSASLVEHLNEGHFDLAISGIPINTTYIEQMAFSDSYLDVTMAFVVQDFRRNDFATLKKIRDMEHLRIGLLGNLEYFVRILQNAFPNADIVELESRREFFEGTGPEIDAILTSAEDGAAWTLLYPSFQVVVPKPSRAAQPLGFPVAVGDQHLVAFLNRWIDLKKKNGDIQRLFDHWILGEGAEDTGPRWSVIRDVLHWVE